MLDFLSSINVNGSVGIGTTTPSNKLTVQLDDVFDQDASGQIVIKGNTNNNKSLKLGYDTTSNYAYLQAMIVGTTASPIILNPWSGFVGIGTTSPQKELEISKSGGATLRISNSYHTLDPGDLVGNIEFWNNDADTPKVGSYIKSVAAETYGRKGALTFGNSITTNTDAVEVMRLNESGYLGVGTTAPNQLVHIQKDQNASTVLKIRNNDTGSTNYSMLAVNSYGNAWGMRMGSIAANSNALQFVVDALDAPVAKMTIQTNGDITAVATITATNFILSSDERQKTNIVPLTIAPINIEYKQFELISEPNVIRYGVIAQDLQKVNPELIRTDDKGIMSVAYIDLLVKEIASLKQRVCELERKSE